MIIKDAFNDIKRKISQKKSDISSLVDKYLSGELSNQQMVDSSRNIFRVVVGQKNSGSDFSDIQTAIDYINDRGGGTILIKSGTITC